MCKKKGRSCCRIIACFTFETGEENPPLPPHKNKPSKHEKMNLPPAFQKPKENIKPTKSNDVEGTTTVTKPPSTTKDDPPMKETVTKPPSTTKDDPPMKETGTTSEAAGNAKKGTTATVHLNLKIPTKE